MKQYLYLLLSLTLGAASSSQAQKPAFDHIVVVLEENHSFSQIIGDPEAPNINALAASGANIINAATDPSATTTGSHAVRHPSQPNYLELYSGSNQGTIQDGRPGTIEEPFTVPPPFDTSNLGADLRNAGLSFATYSQGLPSVGFDGDSVGDYYRKHNPAANWVNDSNPTANQLPSTVNQPFTTFQAIGHSVGTWANLPTVSFVVPDQQNDMHDGTIGQADTWLKTNVLDTYLVWAKTHNSLLILTFDEDGDNTPSNQITTIFAGAKITAGDYPESNLNGANPYVATPGDPGVQTPTGTAMNHYNVLATIEDIYGLSHIGGSFNRPPVSDIFSASIFLGPLVVPNALSTTQGDTGNLFPLFSAQPIRYQQVFKSSEFSRLNPGGGLINRIAFRGHGPGIPFAGAIPQLQVNLSTTSKAPDELSSTFASNVGSDDTQVFSGALATAVSYDGDPTDFEIVISFNTPFYYDPAKGNLLLDVRNVEGGTQVPDLDQLVDGTLANNDALSRVYSYGDVNAASAGADAKDTYGLVARFNTITAASRKTHGSAGDFDVNLPLLGTPGLECRTGGSTGDYLMVVTFAAPVTLAEAQVTEGAGQATATVSGNQVLINLSGVTNAQTIKVTLVAVNDGTATNDVTIPMSILIGDTTADGNVNSADIAQTKAQSGAIVGADNFREDVTVDGSLNSADIGLVKSQSGTGLTSASTARPRRSEGQRTRAEYSGTMPRPR